MIRKALWEQEKQKMRRSVEQITNQEVEEEIQTVRALKDAQEVWESYQAMHTAWSDKLPDKLKEEALLLSISFFLINHILQINKVLNRLKERLNDVLDEDASPEETQQKLLGPLKEILGIPSHVPTAIIRALEPFLQTAPWRQEIQQNALSAIEKLLKIQETPQKTGT